jgi:transposase
MLNLALPGRVFLCTLPTDMRKSFDSLAGLVQRALDQDPLSGDLFVFRSKRGDRVKLLYWDQDGLAIWYKRLEEGTFTLPAADGKRGQVGDHGLVLRPAELAMLLDGIDLASVKRHKRYQRPRLNAATSA